MNSIIVVPTEGKWKVLNNYIQYGIAYSSKEQADKEAKLLKEKLTGKR